MVQALKTITFWSTEVAASSRLKKVPLETISSLSDRGKKKNRKHPTNVEPFWSFFSVHPRLWLEVCQFPPPTDPGLLQGEKRPALLVLT